MSFSVHLYWSISHLLQYLTNLCTLTFFTTTDFQPIRDLTTCSADSCRRSSLDFLLKMDQESGQLLEYEGTLVFILPSYLEQQRGKHFAPWRRSLLAVSTCDTEEGHGGAIGDLRGVLLLHHQARNPLRHHGASSSPTRESHHCRTTLVVALYAVHLFTAVYWHTSGSARTLLSTDVGFRGLAPMPSGGNQLRTKVRATLPP